MYADKQHHNELDTTIAKLGVNMMSGSSSILAVGGLRRCSRVQNVLFYYGNTVFVEDPQHASRAPPGLSRGLQGVPKASPRAPQGPPRESEWTPNGPRELPWVSPGASRGGAKESQRSTEWPQSSKRAQRNPRGGLRGAQLIVFV